MSQKYTNASGAFYEVGFFMEPNLSAPIDARTVVEFHSDLANISTKYIGMVVSVTDDTAELNGLYMYTSALAWEKVTASTPGGTSDPYGFLDVVAVTDPLISDISVYNGVLVRVDPDDKNGGIADLTLNISTFASGAIPIELIGKNYTSFNLVLDEPAKDFITDASLAAGNALVIGEGQSVKLWRMNNNNFYKIGMV
jgi:hypothetical protein